MEDRVRDGSRGADHCDLAETFRANTIRERMRLANETDINLANICVHRYHVVGKVVVEPTPETRIDLRFFAKHRSDRPDDPTTQLTGGSSRAYDAPTIGNTDDPWNPYAPCLRFDTNLHEMRHIAKGRELWICRTRNRIADALHLLNRGSVLSRRQLGHLYFEKWTPHRG